MFGAAPLASIFRRTKEDAPPASREWKEIPPALERILARALARDAADRYALASEMLNELRGLRREMAISPLSDFHSPAKRQRRSSV